MLQVTAFGIVRFVGLGREIKDSILLVVFALWREWRWSSWEVSKARGRGWGSETIDLLDKIEEYVKPNTMKTFDISSNKVTFDNCLLNEVVEVLDGQYAISSVEVIVINPVPED